MSGRRLLVYTVLRKHVVKIGALRRVIDDFEHFFDFASCQDRSLARPTLV